MAKALLTQKVIDSLICPSTQSKLDVFDTKLKGFACKVSRKGNKSYFIRYVDAHGKRVEKRIADAVTVSLADARPLAQSLLGQISAGDDPFEKKSLLRNVPTFKDFISESYMPFVKGYKRSWVTDESHLRNHILPALGHLYMDEIKRQHMVNLFSQHRAEHKAATTNRVIILTRFIFNSALRWEVPGLEKNPTRGIPMYPEDNKLERFLTVEEAQRLFQALEESDSEMLKYIVTMLLVTGARRSEVFQAKWEDFNVERRQWTVEFNKTGKPRYIPLSDIAIANLQQVPRIEGCEYAFPNLKTGQPYNHIFRSWDNARKKAGLPELRIHDLRHSFASFLVNSGRSLYEVQKILGHTQIKTTQRYAHLSQDSLISAANTVSSLLTLEVESRPQQLKDITLIEAQ